MPKFKPKVDPTTTPVTTVNGNGRQGAAASGGAALGTWGYPVTVSLNPAPTFDFRQSVVYYRPGDQQAAGDVADILGSAVARPITAAYKAYASHGLVVVLGKSFTGKLAHEASKSTGGLPSDVTRDSTTYRADFQAANGPANFPVLYPTVRQDASTFVPWITSPIRTYNIKEAGGGNNSLYAYWGYNGIAGVLLGDRGDTVHQGADPGESRPEAHAGRAHVPVLLQRLAHPHGRLHRARHRLLGAEHASR